MVSFRIQVWKEQDGKKLQWKARGLSKGSEVEVGVSKRDQYWIWENVLKSDQMFWRFGSGLGHHRLYLGFNNSNIVQMRSDDSQT